MRKKHWSSNPGYNQRYWTEVDWKDWEKHGRPKVPIDNRLGFGPDTPRRLDTTPVVQPQHLFNGFDLYAKPQPRAGRRGPANPKIDELLGRLGVRPRRRTTAEELVTLKRTAGTSARRAEVSRGEPLPDGVPVSRSAGHVLRVR